MNWRGKLTIQGKYPAHGLAIVLSLALASIFLPLPLFILAAFLLAPGIVRFRASPLPEACLPVVFPARPSLRGPPA
jgi:hypothetical protein